MLVHVDLVAGWLSLRLEIRYDHMDCIQYYAHPMSLGYIQIITYRMETEV